MNVVVVESTTQSPTPVEVLHFVQKPLVHLLPLAVQLAFELQGFGDQVVTVVVTPLAKQTAAAVQFESEVQDEPAGSFMQYNFEVS